MKKVLVWAIVTVLLTFALFAAFTAGEQSVITTSAVDVDTSAHEVIITYRGHEYIHKWEEE